METFEDPAALELCKRFAAVVVTFVVRPAEQLHLSGREIHYCPRDPTSPSPELTR